MTSLLKLLLCAGVSASAQMPPLPLMSSVPSPKPFALPLVWNASTGAVRYTLYQRTTGKYLTSLNAGTNLGLIVSNLWNSNTYNFTVTATETSGLESDSSNEVQWRPLNPPMTNFVLVTCTGNLLMSLGLTGTRFSVTNQLFRLTRQGDWFWWSASAVHAVLVSNNQVNWGKFELR